MAWKGSPLAKGRNSTPFGDVESNLAWGCLGIVIIVWAVPILIGTLVWVFVN